MGELQIDSRTIEIRPASLEQIIALRHRELRPGLPRVAAEFEGDAEPRTRHFGAFDGAEAVGCVSLMPSTWEGQAAYQLRGMATQADRVGRGVGTALLSFAVEAIARESTATWLWCNARVAAAGFYEKAGWRIVSDIFDVPTVGPHYRMVRALPRS